MTIGSKYPADDIAIAHVTVILVHDGQLLEC
jgi:hypothetical protein